MKIAEVSEQFGMSVDTLRYYERVGLIPPVNRNESGIRDYSELDLRRVDFIKCMRSAGLPVEVLIEYVALVQQGDSTIEARKEILKEQRALLAARMEEMQKTLGILDHKLGARVTFIMGLIGSAGGMVILMMTHTFTMGVAFAALARRASRPLGESSIEPSGPRCNRVTWSE